MAAAIIVQSAFWIYFCFFSGATQGASVGNEGAQLSFSAQYEHLASTAEQIHSAGLNPYFWLKTPSSVFYLFVYGLLFALFGLYQQGKTFSPKAAIRIQQLGICAILWPIFESVYPPVLLVTMKLAGVIQHGEISIGFGSDQLGIMATGVMIMVIGWVMKEAHHISKEQELTI